VRGQSHAVGSLGQVKHVPRPDAQAREHVLGQDDAGGVADPGDFEGRVYTEVITPFRNGRNSSRDASRRAYGET
jgi:hypothetical protein